VADQAPGEGKLAIFNLGEKGVVNFKDPLHVTDGELMQSQNAVANHPDEGTGGLEKRGGMAKVNAIVMAGPVQGIISVPLPNPKDPVTFRRFYWADSTGGPDADNKNWRTSTDGAYWGVPNSETAPPGAAQLDTAVPHVAGQGNYRDIYCASQGGKLYYPAYFAPAYPVAGYQVPSIRVFDGTVDAELCKIPYPIKVGGAAESLAIARLDSLNNQLYVVTVDDLNFTFPNQRGRVFALDGDTGALIQVGNAFGPDAGEALGGVPQQLAWHGGRLWAGTINGAGSDNPQQGKVYWIRPLVDEDWTLDHTMTANQGDVTGMVEYNGDLYVGTSGFTGFAALILKRTPAGVWSTSLTGSKLSTGGASTYWAGLRVFAGNLYAIYMGTDGAGYKTEAWKFNGTAWAMDQDLGAGDLITRWPGMTVVRGDALYVALVASTWRLWRKVGGVWSNVLFEADTGSPASFFGYVE
jgi:hypothetical protein